ncbi:MAG TPA: hypothetical protein VHE09_14225 [Rhizomicrobium sp.]|nr:hypothetical protein [Rhizomicrobium sp.]
MFGGHHAFDFPVLRIYKADDAVKAAGAEIAKNMTADRCLAWAAANQDNRLRRKQAIQSISAHFPLRQQSYQRLFGSRINALH